MSGEIVDPDQFFWHQRILSRRLLLVIGIHAFTMVGLHWQIWKYRWRCFFFSHGSPHVVALMRILMCGVIFTHLSFYAVQHWLPLTELPTSARQPLPLIGWLVDILPISPNLYKAALALGIVFSGLAALGLFTRFSLLILIPLVFYLFGVPQFYGKLSHYQFFFWIVVILAFAPNHLVWSLDGILARIRGIRINKNPTFGNGVVLRWIALTLAGIYFFSGFRKLYEAGLFWALSDNPVNLLRTEWLEQFEYLPLVRVDESPLLCSLAAMGVILFELAYPLMIFTPRGRRIAALEAIAFHNLNGYFLKIDFVYLKTAHLSYFGFQKPFRWLQLQKRRWLAWLLPIVAVQILGPLTGTYFLFPILLVLASIDLFWHRIPRFKRGRWILQCRKWLSKPPSAEIRRLQASKWLRLSLATGSLLITLNFLCGAFGIHSWPFSAYPTYSFVRKATVEYGWFIPMNNKGEILDLDQAAKAINFRKENILPMAERIVEAWKYAPAELPAKIQACWLRWRTEVPSLQAATSAKVVIREFPLDPESYGRPVSETSLGELQLKNEEWQYISDSLIQKLQVPK